MEKIVESASDRLPGAEWNSGAPATISDGPTAALSWRDGQLLRHGLPARILSGSLHYFRVHPDYWHDRLQRLVDLGLNCVDTYTPWNFHQPHESTPPDFNGWRDIGAFIDTAAEVGLDVILRPGPYICAEWSNGGLPAWLTRREISLRSSDPGFLGPVGSWFDELIPRLTPYQAASGGPVIAFQVENEFGSFGDDRDYPRWVAEQLQRHGVTELLYTADGPTDVMLDGGSIPGILTAATLGSKPETARALLASRRHGEPFLVAEFWNGWFDHWGHRHHVRNAQNAATALGGIIADGGSVSIYMAHGGTNFGLWAGANHVDGELRPTVTSYDSDAPIAEDGTLTEKFFALREVLAPERGKPASAQPTFLPPQSLMVEPGPDLDTVLDRVISHRSGQRITAPSFEELGLDSGMVRYHADVLLPASEVTLRFDHVADRAMVSVDGAHVGIVTGKGEIRVTGRGRTARISVLVENLGRVNYGPGLGEQKGLLGGVLVERRLIQAWNAEVIDIAALQHTELAGLASLGASFDGAGAAHAVLEVDDPRDTHLALPGFTKGFVWINGFLLGRYWNIGPQQTLYVPGPLLRAGENEIVILELEKRGAQLELRSRPELGPTEQYIEEF